MRAMRNTLLAVAVGAVVGLAPTLAAPVPGQTEDLFLSYLRLTLAQQVPRHAAAFSRRLSVEDQSQVATVTAGWLAHRLTEMRAALENRFGDRARSLFQSFVSEFTLAESRKDAAYLERIVRELQLERPWPADYASLQHLVLEERLQAEVELGSNLLGEIQTWADLRQRVETTPPLEAWLTRDEAPGSATEPPPPVEPSLADRLAAAEGGSGAVDWESLDAENPMETFSAAREARRARILEDARAGMEQVAAERKAAEEEYAARKMAAAQAEAEAMKRQAEELAAVEKEALDQRQHSWSARLKKLVGTAAGSFGGAFLGGVGARAGEEAIDAVWPP